jgi:hypothetical protein
MPREEGNFAPLELAENERIGGFAEGCLHALFVHIRKSGHRIQPAAPDNANLCLRHLLLPQNAQGLKPMSIFGATAARLKPCPVARLSVDGMNEAQSATPEAR